MKKTALLLLFIAVVPLEAKAFNSYDNSDVLSYVAMPLAVSAVCDVQGVQTDRVGQLVTYMDQANVTPADFIDVLRYVPVALVLRTDNRPDFVEWVHGEVDRGLVGEGLVNAMETQLRTYDPDAAQVRYRPHRRYRSRDDYAYAYEPDYVPVIIRRHCERFLEDPLSLVEMPVAVTHACDLGLPYDRVGGLVVELNLGDVPPLQFVEVMRYAPAALVVTGDYYGQPDFVQFVRTRRIGGITGYPLVQSVDRQLRYYNVAPQIDLAPPQYANQPGYVPQVAQNFVNPANPAFFPTAVRNRVTTTIAAGNTAFSQPVAAVAAPSQVQRLLASPGSGAVVANPGQMRRELAREKRAQREVAIAAAPVLNPAPAMAPGRFNNRGRKATIAQQPVFNNPAIAGAPHGNGRGSGHEVRAVPTPMISSAPAPVIVDGEHGRGHAAVAAPPAVAQPATIAAPHEHGRGHAPAAFAAPAPVVATPQPPAEHGRGHAAAADTPVAVAPPPAATAPAAAQPGPPHGPPGQEKKKGKGKDN
jgi:hypothetical protein